MADTKDGKPEPRIAGTTPTIMDLEAGVRHAWCACGLSARQPMCDGSHRGTAFTPVKFTLPEPARRALCNCKRTAGPPWCDGSHSRLAPAGGSGG